MSDLRKAAEMALEALECVDSGVIKKDYLEATIKALRDRLEQPEPEPVAWNGECVLGHCGSPSGCDDSGCCRAAPPKREWQGLTSDNKHFLLANAWNKEQAFDDFMEAIDKFLEEKNT
jgi:hypothetical protein